MKFKKLIFILIFLFAFPLTASSNEKNFSIMCSLFPVYDFAKEVAKDYAEINLILRPGVEPHEFEPSPLDIKKLNDADVFIFTGRYMEEWAEKFSRSLKNTLVIDASENPRRRFWTWSGKPYLQRWILLQTMSFPSPSAGMCGFCPPVFPGRNSPGMTSFREFLPAVTATAASAGSKV